VRAITTSSDKEFANNVAVNQNNQNQMGTGFLRSNDPRVVQLAHALASSGWYLERREGELDAASAAEKTAIETRIGRPLSGRVITLKEGAQAYVATFFGQPELAKKNVKKMFLSAGDGGYFGRIFSTDLTAEKMIVAHSIKSFVDDFIRQFMMRKRRKERNPDWQTDYKALLGNYVVEQFGESIDQVMPQSSVFLCGTICQDYVEIQGKDFRTLPDAIRADGTDMIRAHIGWIMEFAQNNPRVANKSWPNLLKSMAFFERLISYIRGLRAPARPNGSYYLGPIDAQGRSRPTPGIQACSASYPCVSIVPR
jgi:hypothetical protein